MRTWALLLLVPLGTLACVSGPRGPAASPQKINAVVKQHESELRSCLLIHRMKKDPAAGEMVLHFFVEPNGSTSHVSVNDAFDGSAAGDCAIKTVKTWTFPTFAGAPVEVNLPLSVESGSAF